MNAGRIASVNDYLEVTKPSASLLLTFIGICSAIIAAGGQLSPRFAVIAITILVASAGANGLTNYLDCGLDARMLRTRHRALAAKRIYPPEKVLPLNITLVVIGLALAWVYLHPYAFAADLVGTVAAVAWRKKSTCVFPQGMLASCAPVLMGWFAIQPRFSWEIVLLCVLIAFWLPLHVWSVMIAHRQDYLNAGLTFFPMSREVKDAVKVLLAFAVVLYAASLALYFKGGFALLYLIVGNILGVLMIYATAKLTVSSTSKNAWRLYKLSAFPYLGALFLVMCLDIWLLR